MTVFSDSMLLRRAKKDPPVFISESSAGSNSAVTTVTVTAPTSQAGDLIVAVFAAAGNVSEPQPASGFTLVSSLYVALEPPQFALYTRVATSSEPSSYTFEVSVAAAKRVMVLVYRGASSIGSVSTKVRPGSSTIPIPAITLAGSGALVAAVAGQNGGDTPGIPSGMTPRSGDSSSSPSAYLFDLIPTVSGSSGTTTATLSPDTQTAGFQFEVLP